MNLKTFLGLPGRALPPCLALPSAILLGGCVANVFTPPARIAEMQGPAALREDRMRVTGAAGFEAGVFQAEMAHAAVLARRGLGDGWEGGVGANATVFDGEDRFHQGIPWIGAMHGELKYNPPHVGNHLALLGGSGIGWGTGGGFVSADAGLILGADNWYFSPYLGGKAMINQPFATRTVRFDIDWHSLESGGDRKRVGDRAELTYGLKSFLGIRLPLAPAHLKARAPHLIVEANFAGLFDSDREVPYFGLFAGLEFPVGGMAF